MPKLGILIVALVAVCGCADNAARPATYREMCEQNATITCAYDSRRDVCAGRTAQVEVACTGDFVAQCCALAGDCEARVTAGEVATFDAFDACDAAVLEMSCAEIDSRTKPALCDGVVK